MKHMTIVALMLALSACSAAPEAEAGFEFDFSLDETLDDLRNCDLLSETFVAVVREATEQIDAVAAATGRIPAAELTTRVDALTQSGYFAVAERLGCDVVAQRVETIERLRGLDPQSTDAEDLVAAIIDELNSR